MGTLHILRDFPSPPERITRTLRVYLPDAYEREPTRRFPVLYMQDAQNLFAHPSAAIPETWRVNETVDRLFAAGTLPPWIVVAVDHRGVDRIGDFTPWPDEQPARGPSYAAFLVQHLKPYVDATWRTQPGRSSTAVAGSSLGGLISLYLGLTHPEVFSRVGALSPSVMWCQRRIFTAWDRHVPVKVYLDAGATENFWAGDQEWNYGRDTAQFHAHLQSLGYTPEELRVVLEPHAPHHESCWARRLPDALAWLLR